MVQVELIWTSCILRGLFGKEEVLDRQEKKQYIC